MNNRGFQCTVLSLTTSNFKLEVEKSDVGQGLGKFLKRGVDVFDLFDGGEEKLIMKSAKSSPRKKGEEEENEEQTRFNHVVAASGEQSEDDDDDAILVIARCEW